MCGRKSFKKETARIRPTLFLGAQQVKISIFMMKVLRFCGRKRLKKEVARIRPILFLGAQQVKIPIFVMEVLRYVGENHSKRKQRASVPPYS